MNSVFEFWVLVWSNSSYESEKVMAVNKALNENYISLPFLPRKGDLLDLSSWVHNQKLRVESDCLYRVLGIEYRFPMEEDLLDKDFSQSQQIHLHLISALYF